MNQEVEQLVKRLRAFRNMTFRMETVDERTHTIRFSFEAVKAIQELCGEAADFIIETTKEDLS